MIRVVHVSDRKLAHREYVGRGKGSVLGNPFKMRNEGEREQVVQKYRSWLWRQIQLQNKEVIRELARLANLAKRGDLELACWCKPKACHGDVLKACIEWMLTEKSPVDAIIN